VPQNLTGILDQVITVVNRSRERGQQLVHLLNEKTTAAADLVPWADRYTVPPETNIVVNATSIGLFPNVEAQLDIDLDSLRPEMIVADVIPNPPCTRLVAEARTRGCTVIDGLGMLVNQGVIGITYWTGIDVDPQVMRARLEEVLP